jgi:hypothetical protein
MEALLAITIVASYLNIEAVILLCWEPVLAEVHVPLVLRILSIPRL